MKPIPRKFLFKMPYGCEYKEEQITEYIRTPRGFVLCPNKISYFSLWRWDKRDRRDWYHWQRWNGNWGGMYVEE